MLQLIRNENQNIKYETIDALCDFFNIGLSNLLLYSPIHYEFESFDFIRSFDKKVSSHFDKDYYDNIFTLTLKIDSEIYTFAYDCFDTDIYEGTNLYLWCPIEKEKYESLIAKGHNKHFFNTYCDLIIKDKIKSADTSLNSIKNFNSNIEFIVKNAPDYDEITADLKYLPSDELLELKEYVSLLLNESSLKED